MAGISRKIAQNLSHIQYRYVTDSIYRDTKNLEDLYSSRNEPSSILQLADYFAQRGQFTHAQNVLNNVDQTWWGEADVLTAFDAIQLYNRLANASANGEGLNNLSLAVRGDLQALQNNTASTWVWHKINTLLTPYGENNKSYIEPIYFSANNKITQTTSRSAKAVSSFKLYPNPAKNYFELHWDWMASGLDDALTLYIHNLEGKILYHEIMAGYSNNVWLVDTDKLQNGMYLVEIQNAAHKVIFSEKLSVVK